MNMVPQSQPPQAAQPAVMGEYGFPRDNRILVKAVVSLFILEMVFRALLTVVGIIELKTLGTQEGIDKFYGEELSTLSVIMLAIGIPFLFVSVILVVFYCIWKNRSCKNAWLLTPQLMTTTPGWAVGWYFIPIMWFFKPYTAMREIRDASCPKDKLSTALPLWCTLWIISMVAGFVTGNLTLSIDDIEAYKRSSMIEMVMLVPNIILSCAIIRIVLTITAAQMPRLQALTPVDGPQTPPGHQPPAH